MAGSDTQAFAQAAVQPYLRAQLLGFEGPLQVTMFEGGQSNSTFLFKAPAHAYVLRRKLSGVLLKLAHAVDCETRVQIALHRGDINAAGLREFGPEGNYFVRQRGWWSEQYRASDIQRIPAMDQIMDALAEQQPADDGQRTLVHGNYQIENFVFHLGLAFFRMAAIIQGVLKRALDGNASTPRQALKRG